MSFTLCRRDVYAVSDFCFSDWRVEFWCSRVAMRESRVGISVPFVWESRGEPF
jgi:hypothetical protein